MQVVVFRLLMGVAERDWRSSGYQLKLSVEMRFLSALADLEYVVRLFVFACAFYLDLHRFIA